MPSDETDLWVAPPEWVHLPDVPSWIVRRYAIAQDSSIQDIIVEVIAAVRRHDLTYRVTGFRFNDFDRHSRIPAGLVRSADVVTVADWTAADVDWRAGTVGGWPIQDGTRARHKIELLWGRIEYWARPYAWAAKVKTQGKEQRARTIAGSQPTVGRKNVGGNPGKYDWDEALRAFIRHAALDGLTNRSDATEFLEQWFADQAIHPANSTVREKVALWWPRDLPET